MKDKLVHAEAPLVLLSLIQKLQEPTSFCSKLFEILLFSDSYPRLSVPKARKFEKLGMNKALLTTLSNKRHCWIL